MMLFADAGHFGWFLSGMGIGVCTGGFAAFALCFWSDMSGGGK